MLAVSIREYWSNGTHKIGIGSKEFGWLVGRLAWYGMAWYYTSYTNTCFFFVFVSENSLNLFFLFLCIYLIRLTYLACGIRDDSFF